jgi:uncharacterized membrane protein
MIKNLILAILICLSLRADGPLPFWKSKSEVYKKMKEDRYIPVSAHTVDADKGKKLTVVTAGIIHAPLEFAHSVIMKFDDYPKFLSYVVASPLDKVTNDIFLHGAFMGYHVQMTIHINVEKVGTGERVKWKSVAGGFLGMGGVINEEVIDKDHSEISLDSSYVGKTIALPAFILDWGLEYAAQKTASSMRSHIESEWEASKKGTTFH